MMAAATAESQYFFHVISEEQPNLSVKRHIDMEVGQESFGARFIMLVTVIMHNLSPFCLWKIRQVFSL
jgi:hypothetical protein